MTKHTLFTENEFNNFEFDARVLKQIEQYKAKNNLKNPQIRVLDWGCGKGREVLWLREAGYTSFGVDIDKEVVKNGLPLFEKKGYESSILKTVLEDNKTDFPDEFFDIILSNQVFEHVEDLVSVISEMKRITKKNGIGYHRFPAHRHIKEVHLYMPFIHWLPKNRLRKFLITFYVWIGIEPKWTELKEKKFREKVDTYYKYSIEKTFYRKPSSLKEVCGNSGFVASFNVEINPAFYQKKILKNLISNAAVNKFFNILFNRFKRVELILTKEP